MLQNVSPLFFAHVVRFAYCVPADVVVTGVHAMVVRYSFFRMLYV